MAVDTHCEPSGSLGTGELPVPNLTLARFYNGPASTGVGNRRGLVVSPHGLGVTQNPYSLAPTGAFGTFCSGLQADGWTVLVPPYAEDFYLSTGAMGIFNDVNNDTGHGSRYLSQMFHWWDHVILTCIQSFPGWPVVIFGASWGGWHALQVAANRTSTLLAYGAFLPVTWVENTNTIVFGSTANFGQLNSSGMDIAANLLNAVTLPGVIGYGTTDDVVGYSGTTTVASGSNNVAASAVTTLNVASSTGFVVASGDLGAQVTVTGLTGGTGRATYSFTGTGTGTLTGATLVSGSGTLTTGLPVVQSQTSALIAAQQAAQPGAPVTADATTNNHLWLSTDTTYFQNWFTTVVDPLAPKQF